MNDSDWQDFELQEALFIKLLLAITGILSDRDLLQVYEFVYVGEPKLAIDTIAAVFEEENKFATPEIVSLVHDLAIGMDLEPEIYTSRLHIECRKDKDNDQNGFEFIESLFIKLLPGLGTVFCDLEMSLIRMYLDVGRYEVALNAIVTIFIEKEKFKKKKFATPEIISLMSDLAIAMKRNPEIHTSKADGRGYSTKKGTRDGVDIKVVYDTRNKRILTAYPTNLPRNS